MWAEDVLDPSTVRLRAIREDRRVIAEAMEREADAVDGKPGESDMEQIVGVGQASALRAFARALRGEP